MMLPNRSNITSAKYHTPEFDKLIQEHADVLYIPAKTVFLEPGEPMKGLYYIAHGRTRHYMVARDGSEKILYILSDGWFFGETADHLPKCTELFSKTDIDTTIYSIPWPVYQDLLGKNDIFCNAILESCRYKMLIMKHEIGNLSFNSCRYRLQYLLCTIADTTQVIDGAWYNLRISYSQNDICSIIGSARITVAKLMSDLSAEGFIRTMNRNTQVNQKKYENFLKLSSQSGCSDV